MRRLFVCAGEASGDRFAAPVLRVLRARHHSLQAWGIGGSCLAQAGLRCIHDSEGLAVAGFFELVGVLPDALKALAKLVSAFGRQALPDLALLVDYPGFNLRLAGYLRGRGVPVLYYGAPQRWAWRPQGVRRITASVDRLAVTLPFEEPWFAVRGVDCRFVGHPLVDAFRPVERALARRRLGLPSRQSSRCIALLPGSRRQEIRAHLPIMCAALRLLGCPLEAAVAVSSRDQRGLCTELAPGLPQGDTATVLSVADVALCASGSATLEVALAKVPSVVVYRLSRATYAIARRQVGLSSVALPNLLLGRRVLPELIQDDCNPEQLAAQALYLLRPEIHQRVRRGLAALRSKLGQPGVAFRVAALAEELASCAVRKGVRCAAVGSQSPGR